MADILYFLVILFVMTDESSQCFSENCLNGGTCQPSENDPRRYTCQCTKEWAGIRCNVKNQEQEHDESLQLGDTAGSINPALAVPIILALATLTSVSLLVICVYRGSKQAMLQERQLLVTSSQMQGNEFSTQQTREEFEGSYGNEVMV